MFRVKFFRKVGMVLIVAVLVSMLVPSVSSKSTAHAQPGLPPQPSFKFPWDAGQAKVWTGGPHGSLAPSGNYCRVLPGEPWSQAYGIDFGGSFPVLAMAGGTVESAANVGGCGQYGVRILHGNGWATEYCHLSSRNVNPGATVRQGQLIGVTGNAGCPGCGIHLHVNIINQARPYVFWDDKVIDGWRIHNLYALGSGAPLYGEGTATREGTNWGYATGTINAPYCVANTPVRMFVGPKWQTVTVTGSRLVSQSGVYVGTTYGTDASEFRFTSTNVRQ